MYFSLNVVSYYIVVTVECPSNVLLLYVCSNIVISISFLSDLSAVTSLFIVPDESQLYNNFIYIKKEREFMPKSKVSQQEIDWSLTNNVSDNYLAKWKVFVILLCIPSMRLTLFWVVLYYTYYSASRYILHISFFFFKSSQLYHFLIQ